MQWYTVLQLFRTGVSKPEGAAVGPLPARRFVPMEKLSHLVQTYGDDSVELTPADTPADEIGIERQGSGKPDLRPYYEPMCEDTGRWSAPRLTSNGRAGLATLTGAASRSGSGNPARDRFAESSHGPQARISLNERARVSHPPAVTILLVVGIMVPATVWESLRSIVGPSPDQERPVRDRRLRCVGCGPEGC